MTALKNNNGPRGVRSAGYCLFFILLTIALPPHLRASSEPPGNTSNTAPADHGDGPTAWYKNIETEWGGHFKLRGTVSNVAEDTVFKPVGTGTYIDGSIEGRLNSRILFDRWGYFDAHYKMVLFGGDAWQSIKELERVFPDLTDAALLFLGPVNDDNRLMNLTGTISETDDAVLYHRIDRLALTLSPEWGIVRIGRQAVTWGNGLLFNPMDIINPFSPEDIDRDYKTGEDMAFVQVSAGRISDVQAVYVPRRDPVDGNVKWNASSLAGKAHFSYGTTEFDAMAAHHFNDQIIGLGSTGYLRDAAWRIDGTWTFLGGGSGNSDYLTLAANIDYSWTWWRKNLYGFLEYYFNGLGDTNYPEAITDPDIVARIARGEIFTLGRNYLSGHLRLELHPLFNLSLTVINNLDDPSGLIQPYAAWDVKQNCQILFGGSIYYGAGGTEFGGFPIPGTDFRKIPADSAFFWFFYYF